MKLIARKGHWHVHAWYFEAGTGRRVRVRKSTGILANGVGSKRRAEIVGAEIERTLALGHGRPGSSHSLLQAFKALAEQRALEGAPEATREIMLQKAQPLMHYFGPDTAVETITTDHLADYARVRGRAPGTIRRELIELRSAIGSLKLDPPKLPKLAAQAPRERWLTVEEQTALVAALPELWREHVIAYLQLGVRKSELHRIEARDVRAGNVRVRGTKTEGADRVVPMTEQVRVIVERRAGRTKTGPLFESWHNADRDLRAAGKAAKLGAVSFNDLRRSFATQLAIEGVPILHLMHLLGHKSTRMLEQVYARVGQGPHMSAAVAKLPAIG